jgi:CubicO group peptidase (beta-lactamase class C family)
MGLGFGIRTERGRFGGAESVGTYSWGGGLVHHYFWVDPKEQLIGVVLSQLVPDQPQDLLRRFRVLAYQSVVD